MSSPLPWDPTYIVSNPPYSRAQEFVRQALELTESLDGNRVAMYLKATWHTAKTRLPWLRSTPLARVYFLAGHRALYPEGYLGKRGGGLIDYAWFVWEHGHQGDWTGMVVEA